MERGGEEIGEEGERRMNLSGYETIWALANRDEAVTESVELTLFCFKNSSLPWRYSSCFSSAEDEKSRKIM